MLRRLAGGGGRRRGVARVRRPFGYRSGRALASADRKVPVGREPDRVLLVEVNGDGRADAITANSESHDVTVLLAK